MKRLVIAWGFALCYCLPTWGFVARDKILGVDFGFGIPQLIAAQAQLMVLPHFQFGLSYGMVPGSMSFTPQLSLDDRTASFADGNDYQITPEVSTSLASVCPFVRYYPTDRNFYVQLTYGLLRSSSDISSPLTSSDGQTIPGATLTGKVIYTQSLPTLTIGHVFSADTFSINLGMGISVLDSLSTEVSLSGTIPDALGGASGNSDAFDSFESEIALASQRAGRELRQKAVIIPSLFITFGFYI